jgi:hypothetical protein
VRSNSGDGTAGGPHRDERDADRQRHERDQDRGVVDGASGREDQREEQDRAELPDGSGGEQEGAEPRLELPAVRQDRDQRADRGRGDRRARVDQREHDPRSGEEPPDRVRQREREGPAEHGETQRPAHDPVQVDLVAGEEEQHPEAEVREEVDELRDVQAEHLRADDDAEQQFDHDRRQQQPAAGHQCGHRPRDGGRRDDDEEVRRLDLDRREDHELAHTPIAVPAPARRIMPNG